MIGRKFQFILTESRDYIGFDMLGSWAIVEGRLDTVEAFIKLSGFTGDKSKRLDIVQISVISEA